MKKRRSTTPLLIIAFLVIGIAILFVFRTEKRIEEKGGYVSSTATPEPTATPVPGGQGSAAENAEPTATPEPTEAPTATPSPTPSPTPTAEPTPTATPAVSYEESGEFRSDSGTYLNIIVKWSVNCPGDGNNTLKVDVYTESYALFNAARKDDVCIKLNGEKTYVDSPAIDIDVDSLTETPICSQTLEIGDEKKLDLSVDWVFNGQYSKKDVGTLTASGIIQIP